MLRASLAIELVHSGSRDTAGLHCFMTVLCTSYYRSWSLRWLTGRSVSARVACVFLRAILLWSLGLVLDREVSALLHNQGSEQS